MTDAVQLSSSDQDTDSIGGLVTRPINLQLDRHDILKFDLVLTRFWLAFHMSGPRLNPGFLGFSTKNK